jgi:sugar lactone lactonase YvrE
VNKPGTSATFSYLESVAVDGSGNVYIPVSEYSIVVRLGTDGNLTLFAGTGVSGYNGDGGRATSAQLLYPQGVAVDGSGNVYIADAYRIRKVTPAGVISTIAGNGNCCSDAGDGGLATSAQLYDPERVAVDASGNVYISESSGYNGSGYKIRKVTKETGIIITIAGTGTAGYNGDNIPATSAQLNYPLGVGVDAAGNVYIADTDNWRIRKVDGVTGIITTVAGNGSYGYNGDGILATSATVAYPRDVAADAAGNLYIADSDNNRIRKVTLDGIINTIAGNGNWQFSGDGGPATAAGVSYPIGVALGAGGSFYIADSNNGRIREVNSEGIIGTIAGGGGGAGLGDGGPALGAQLDYPYGVAADLWGGVYIADYENNRIAKVSAAGIISTVAGNGSTGCGGELGDGGPATSAGLCYPQDVAVDRSGSLYIADSNNQRIRKVTPAGIISTIAGNGGWGYTGDGGPATSAQLNGPDGVAVDAAGNVYIADTQNNAIRKVDANGIISTIAGDGTGNSGYSGDGGPATNALLSYPQGVAVDAAGNVYIADTDNSAIRKVNAVGVISTIAGGSCNGNLGDGGPAASASLCYPQGVAVDTAGNLYIADSDNNIIRIVTPAGIINTIAGNGNWGFSGDGGWATNAELAGPTAVAVGPFGIYIADSQNQRVRVLPTGSTSQPPPSCWFTVSPSSVTAAVAGGSFSFLVSDSGGCSWTVTGLPAWVKASATSGGGSSTVTLTVAANNGLARSANVYIGGDIVQITQAGATTSCSYSLGGLGQGFPTTGGSGLISVTAVDGCTWTASTPPDWVTYTSPSSGTGSGSVSYTVAANAGRWRTDAVTFGGASYTISQQGAVSNMAGSLAHFASGGGWQTTFTLVNTDFGPAQAQLSFFDVNGQPMTQSFIGPNPAQPVKALADTAGTSSAGTMNPGASLQVDAPANPGGESGGALTGSAQLSSNGRVGAFGVVRLSTATGVQEAAVPLETRGATSYYLPFDNTGGYFYGVALSNTTGTQSGVGVTVRDSQSGAVVASEVINLPAYGQTAFLLADRYPALAGTSGTVQFGSQLNGQLSVLGLRFNANHAFTSVPTLVNTAPTAGLANAGALAHLAAGGGWRTIYTLANTGSTPSEAKLSFFGDDGKPLALAVSATQAASSTSQTATTFDQTLKPGTVLILETTSTADQPEQTGWAQLATTGGISGFAVFQSSATAATQEAAVQLDAASASDLLLAFDNTNGYSNGIALANTSAQAVNVTVNVHDAATGKTIGTDTLQLAADGHVSFTLADKYKETANVRGTLELSVPAGGTISAIGLRVNTNNAFTSLPGLVKQ